MNVDGLEYICASCDAILATESKEMKARSAFIKKFKEFPEYICMCCHRMLFYRSVQIFHEEKYDFDNEDVRETLCDRFRYKSVDKDHEYICQTCHKDLRK